MTTARDVATWMWEQYQSVGELYQRDAAEGIELEFGSDWLVENDLGNAGIDRRVLREFRALSGAQVVWDRRELCWRSRGRGDREGRAAE